MKKKIISVAIVATIALAGGLFFSQKGSEVSLSDIAIANLDAFASPECPNGCLTDGGGVIVMDLTGIMKQEQKKKISLYL